MEVSSPRFCQVENSVALEVGKEQMIAQLERPRKEKQENKRQKNRIKSLTGQAVESSGQNHDLS